MKIKRPFTVKMLVLMSLFIALSIVLTRFASVLVMNNTIRLGIGSVPIIFCGIIFGPVAGGFVGIISDLLGVALVPQGAIHLGFTLSSALTGIIPGLVVMVLKKKNFSAVLISNILIYLIISLFLDTLWASQLYGKAFLVLLPWRAVFHGILTVVKVILITILLKSTEKLKYY